MSVNRVGASAPLDRRRVAPHKPRRERRWPSFIIWRWAGPAQDGWTHSPQRVTLLLLIPRHRPRHPSTLKSLLRAEGRVRRAALGPVAPGKSRPRRPAGSRLAKPPSQPGGRPGRPPARDGRPRVRLVRPPSARPASPVGPPGALLERPHGKGVVPPVSRPDQRNARLGRVPARAGGRAGADRLSRVLPEQPAQRRS